MLQLISDTRKNAMVADHLAGEGDQIGARIVCHGRYVLFQLAKVAVPRALFAEILRPIEWLRGRRDAAERGGSGNRGESCAPKVETRHRSGPNPPCEAIR